MTRTTPNFDSFCLAATGHRPYSYQRVLGNSTKLPAVLDVPTGAGKTEALIVSWLYARRELEVGPRRLVYALPMRSLVEQTRDVAQRIRDRLALDADALPICTLMGGTDQAELREWLLRPERDQILVGTIDMLLSRALNRGYAASRFLWPMPFGLLNNDCRWIFDEVQLMGSARATSVQLDGLRASLGTVLPCETIWASATIDRETLLTVDHPNLGTVLSLQDDDRSGPLRRRLEAHKTLQRVELSATTTDPAAQIADAALQHHAAGTRTLVILNVVNLAQATYRELCRLNPDATLVLLHSRFRPLERLKQMQSALAPPGREGIIVVATQVVEAGVDMSARTLITETAPFSSIVQRLGRCNREGEHEQATVVWIDRGPLGDGTAAKKDSAPYAPDDIEQAREVLLAQVDRSLGPAALEQINVPPCVADDPAVLRRHDLLDLFDTSPDLSGLDVDVAPFIRDDDNRDVTVFFRDVSDDVPGEQPEPQRDELVKAPVASLGKRACWTIDPVDGRWMRRLTNELTAGTTVMLRTIDGGYDADTGWDGKVKGVVDVVPLADPSRPQSIESDPGAEVGSEKELFQHLTEVAEEAERISEALALTSWREVLRWAGALHDVGKAHPVFQSAMRAARDGEEGPDDSRLLAKSGTRGRLSYERPYFRHELASALALWPRDGAVELPSRELIAYLVAAHHGKVRLSIRPAAEEKRPSDANDGVDFALGIVDGDVLPAVQTPVGELPSAALSLAPMRLGAEESWADATAQLRDDPNLGPFRLGFLEALLRIADWRASDA